MVLETDAHPLPDAQEEDAPHSLDIDAPPPPDSPGPPVSSSQGSGRPPFKACITDEVYVLPPPRMIPDNQENFVVSLPLTIGKELNTLRKEDSWSLIVETCKSCKFHARAGCDAQKSKSSLLNIRKFAQACQEPDLHIARFPTPDIYHRRGALEVYLLPPANANCAQDVNPPVFLLHSRLVTGSWPTAGSLARSMRRMPSMKGAEGLTVSVSEPEPPTVAAKQPAEDMAAEQLAEDNDDTAGQNKGPLRPVDEDVELVEEVESNSTSDPWRPEADSGLLRLPPGDALATPMSSLVTSPTSPKSPWI